VNVSMVFVNTHFSTSGPRPNLPNMIEIGGIQIKEKPWPLPKVKEFVFYLNFQLICFFCLIIEYKNLP
jgi:glucuronosyltransferase